MNPNHVRCAALAVGAVALGCLAAPTPAHAWWRDGVAVVVPPPVVVPAPVYVAPPTTVYVERPATGQSCDAGAYVCPTERPLAVGSGCVCPGNRGSTVSGIVH